MKRPIEFRAWDIHQKKYKYPKLWDNTMPSNWEQHYILEQYTGLTDRNGVKIFEGDVLQLDRPLSNHTIPTYVVTNDGVEYILNHHGRNDGMNGERWGRLSRITDADIVNSFGRMIVTGNIHESGGGEG